jgi:hypothetical protein
MISDTLSDAVAEIDRCLSDDAYDSAYEPVLRVRIMALRDEMDAMRTELDTPPQ